MGNISSQGIDANHIRIYNSIIQIQNPQKRVHMINTCLAGVEYITSAKRAGIYSYLLNYVSVVNSGHKPPVLPGEQVSEQPQYQLPPQQYQQVQYYHQAQQAESVRQYSQQYQPPVPRALQQQNPSFTNPYDNYNNPVPTSSRRSDIVTYEDNTPSWKQITSVPKQKAMTYFASCLEVLGIQEEVALTEETLKHAYKKMAIKAHPDKGGSEEYFEAVTRAYAYLSEILKHINGGRKNMNGKVDAPSNLESSRSEEADKWKHVEPVKLNPKNLDMNAFNTMFEQTHIPDPDSDGYGDWLKSADSGGGGGDAPKFSGKFNRDVFNRMFDDNARKNGAGSSAVIVHPGAMALTLAPTSGVDVAGERPDSYTAAPNSRFQYTDLRGAYTLENTVSDKVSNVVVQERSYDQYKASRERAPDPFTSSEMQHIQEYESRMKRQDELLERRKAEMNVRNQQYFDRMKGLLIVDK